MDDSMLRAARPQRVLHMIGRMSPGGAENWLFKLLRKADRNILQMDFCVAKPEEGLYEEEIISLGSKIIRCELKPFLTFQHRLARILSENEYDVIHSHGWLSSGIVLKVAHQCNVPVRIAYSHTTRDQYQRTFYRKLYARLMRRMIMQHSTHCLGCCSEAASALFGKEWNNIDKCGVLYTSVDVEEFRPGQKPSVIKADFGIPSDAVVIGHVGSFRLAKNHTFLLEIAAEIIKRQPKAYIFLAGEGTLRPEAEAKAERLGISDRIIFAGNRNDVPQLMMHLFDVLLFPSIYEGMPLTLVEAVAAGLRVVCSDVISREASEVLPEAFTHLRLDLGAEQWAEKVMEAIEKGRSSHEYAYNQVRNSRFSIDYSLRQLSSIYGCQSLDSSEK
jgi:glycosyltransferase involved in cell wall biosynthesis